VLGVPPLSPVQRSIAAQPVQPGGGPGQPDAPVQRSAGAPDQMAPDQILPDQPTDDLPVAVGDSMSPEVPAAPSPPPAQPELTSPLLGEIDAPVQRSLDPPSQLADGVATITADPAPEPDLPVAAAPPLPVAPLLGGGERPATVPTSTPVSPGPALATSATTPVSRSVAPASTHARPAAPTSPVPAAPVQRSTGRTAPAAPSRRTGMPSDSIPADTRAAMIAAAFAGGAPPTVMRVPASQAPTFQSDSGAPAPQFVDPVFNAVPVSRVSEEQAPVVPTHDGGGATFSSETSTPPAAAAGPPAADPEHLVAQLIGPLYEKLRTEMRRERIRRGSVHDRLG
jgi:hypothetical protein